MFVCAGMAVVGGIVSATLWRELRTERALTAQLRDQLEASQASSTTGALPALARVTPPPVSGADATSTGPAPGKDEPATAPAPQRAPQLDVASLLASQQEMMKDPEYRKARLMQTRMQLPQNYPGLIDALGLSPEEAGKLFDLLAEQQLEMSDVSMFAATVNGVAPDPAVMQDSARRRMEMQGRHDEALSNMLGGRYTQWQDYQQTRGARQQVVQLGRALEGAGLALTSDQSRSLTDAYVAEQRRMRDERQQLISSLTQGGTMDQNRMREEQLKLQAESNRRTLEAARPHLSAQQYSALQASLEQQMVMSRASSRMLQQQMQSGQAPAAITVISAAPAQPVPTF
jgi:hypothetical protein